jgi:hypothetical protein
MCVSPYILLRRSRFWRELFTYSDWIPPQRHPQLPPVLDVGEAQMTTRGGTLRVARADGRGSSLFADRRYKPEEPVMVTVGPIVAVGTRFTVAIAAELFVDPVPVDNLARYLNHSCDPNVGIRHRTVFVALRDIAAGEEVGIDYAMFVDDYGDEITDEQLVCRCGSPHCRGRLGAFDRLPQDLRSKYAPFTSEWLLSRDEVSQGPSEGRRTDRSDRQSPGST